MTTATQIDDTILDLVISGQALTRADIARNLNIAPSTASASVIRLISKGILEEGAERASTGGRRARQLLLRNRSSRAAVAELGVNHARLALIGPSGEVQAPQSFAIRASDGPHQVLTQVTEKASQLSDAEGTSLGALGIALPAPVDADTGVVVAPSRMPNWNLADIHAVASNIGAPPIFVGNDARLGALGEFAFRSHCPENVPKYDNFIYVKAGSAIGAALVNDGKVYEGAYAIAGDIAHVPIAAGGTQPCQCGNRGCLDTVGSADALRRALRTQGLDLPTNAAMLQAATNADPIVVNAIREAGIQLGATLAHIVSFLNPQAVIVGGTLSAVSAYSAGVRQALHELCLPSIMEDLAVETSLAGMDAALWGLVAPTSLLLSARG